MTETEKVSWEKAFEKRHQPDCRGLNFEDPGRATAEGIRRKGKRNWKKNKKGEKSLRAQERDGLRGKKVNSQRISQKTETEKGRTACAEPKENSGENKSNGKERALFLTQEEILLTTKDESAERALLRPEGLPAKGSRTS